jgi:hypothetical protein
MPRRPVWAFWCHYKEIKRRIIMLDPVHLVIALLICADFMFGNPTKETNSNPKTEEIQRESKTKL